MIMGLHPGRPAGPWRCWLRHTALQGISGAAPGWGFVAGNEAIFGCDRGGRTVRPILEPLNLPGNGTGGLKRNAAIKLAGKPRKQLAATVSRRRAAKT